MIFLKGTKYKCTKGGKTEVFLAFILGSLDIEGPNLAHFYLFLRLLTSLSDSYRPFWSIFMEFLTFFPTLVYFRLNLGHD